MTILIIDGMNFCHRARSGFTAGQFSVVYNIFRQLRAQVELHKPSRVIMVMEGHPQDRYRLLPEYKANRLRLPESGIAPDDLPHVAGQEQLRALVDFHRQVRVAVELLQRYFPISVMAHPDHEADDLIYTIVCNGAASADYTIASTDTDFIQVIQSRPNVSLYNPVTKSYVSVPEGYDYLYWKALRGDPSDNVPALSGVTDGVARELLNDPDALRSFFSRDDNARLFERNCSLIKLHHITGDDAMKVTSSSPVRDWDAVKRQFDDWAFKSITKSGTWERFVQTFDALFG